MGISNKDTIKLDTNEPRVISEPARYASKNPNFNPIIANPNTKLAQLRFLNEVPKLSPFEKNGHKKRK